MQIEQGEKTVETLTAKKAYETPQLITHGSVAKMTKNSGGHSDICVPWQPHHRHRWWDCL